MTGRPAETIRTTGSSVLFWFMMIVCVIAIGSLVFGTLSLQALAIAGIPVAAGAVVYALFRYPHVRLDKQQLVLVNPLKTVTIPWNQVDGFETRFGLEVKTFTKKFSSWPLAGKGQKITKGESGARTMVEHHSRAVDKVLEHYAGLSEDDQANPGGKLAVTDTWNLPLIGIVIVALLWAVWGVSAL